MVSTLYDPNLYITNQEYCQKFPDRPPIDVQATVEKPHLYILGQSKSTDQDQLSYTLSRVEDLKQLVEPVEIGGVPIFDVMRVFSGDGPARQFEAGQQRGGNFSCLCGIPSKEHSNLEYALGFHPPSLQDRCNVFKEGCLWRRFSLTNPSPFSNFMEFSVLQHCIVQRKISLTICLGTKSLLVNLYMICPMLSNTLSLSCPHILKTSQNPGVHYQPPSKTASCIWRHHFLH